MSKKESNQVEVFGGDRMRFFSWSQAIIGKLTEENCVRFATEGVDKPERPADYHNMTVIRSCLDLSSYSLREEIVALGG